MSVWYGNGWPPSQQKESLLSARCKYKGYMISSTRRGDKKRRLDSSTAADHPFRAIARHRLCGAGTGRARSVEAERSIQLRNNLQRLGRRRLGRSDSRGRATHGKAPVVDYSEAVCFVRLP